MRNFNDLIQLKLQNGKERKFAQFQLLNSSFGSNNDILPYSIKNMNQLKVNKRCFTQNYQLSNKVM